MSAELESLVTESAALSEAAGQSVLDASSQAVALRRTELTARSEQQAKQRARRRLWKRALLALFACAALATLAWYLRPAVLRVESAVAATGPLLVTVDEDGIARIQDRYVVSAPMTGHLERIEHKPGELVESGSSLARLLPMVSPMLDDRSRRSAEARLALTEAGLSQSKVQMERASARYGFAKDDAARKRALESSGAVPHELVEQAELLERNAASDLESLRFGIQIAHHEAEMARAALGRKAGSRDVQQFEILAPVAGRILRVIQQSEGVVQAGTPLLEIGDPAALEIAVDVLTSDAARIRPSALVYIEGWGGARLEGRVRRVEPSAFTRVSALGVEEQRVNVLVDLTSPRERWSGLGDGYRIEARIVVWQAPRVLQVPSNAVFRQGQGWAAFVVDAGKVRSARVELGERTPEMVEIRSGLAAGDRVVVHASDQVRDGVAAEAQ